MRDPSVQTFAGDPAVTLSGGGFPGDTACSGPHGFVGKNRFPFKIGEFSKKNHLTDQSGNDKAIGSLEVTHVAASFASPPPHPQGNNQKNSVILTSGRFFADRPGTVHS